MEVKRLSKREIIEETISFYEKNPRAADSEGNCRYLDPNTGNKCAYGRCMIDAKQLVGSNKSAFGVHRDSLLLERYRGYDKYFWEDIQELHDYYLDSKTDKQAALVGIGRLRLQYS